MAVSTGFSPFFPLHAVQNFFQMKDLWNKWWPFGEWIHQTDCWVSLAGSTVPRRGAVTAGKQTNVLIYNVAWYPKFQRLEHLISTFLFLRVWDNYWADCMSAWTPHHSPKHQDCKQIPQKRVCTNGKKHFHFSFHFHTCQWPWRGWQVSNSDLLPQVGKCFWHTFKLFHLNRWSGFSCY